MSDRDHGVRTRGGAGKARSPILRRRPLVAEVIRQQKVMEPLKKRVGLIASIGRRPRNGVVT